MEMVKIFILLSVARNVTPRRRIKASSSDESIENLLFYQDCKHTTAQPTTAIPLKLKQEIPKPSCPFPKMCCAMSCNNEPCVSEQLNMYGNQMHPNLEPMGRMQNPKFRADQAMMRARRKKIRPLPQVPLQGPSGRRDFGFTKENIKSLIAKDDDIRKILKDLVRVTMQKVDLQEMIKARRIALLSTTTTTTTITSDSEYIMEEDL